MDEYKFVNPSAPPACVKALPLPPAYLDQIQFQPPTLPQNWGDKGAEGKQKSVDTFPHYQGYASPCTHLA